MINWFVIDAERMSSASRNNFRKSQEAGNIQPSFSPEVGSQFIIINYLKNSFRERACM